MSEVLDLDALEVEQNSTPFGFIFGGERFTIAAGGLDLRITGALRAGDWARGVEMLLGKAEWDRLCDLRSADDESPVGPFQLEHAIALVNAYTAHLGTTVGKSQRSSASSRSKRTPSKRTSNGSTRSRSQR